MKIVGLKVVVETCDGPSEHFVTLEEFAALFTPTTEVICEVGRVVGERKVLRVSQRQSAAKGGTE